MTWKIGGLLIIIFSVFVIYTSGVERGRKEIKIEWDKYKLAIQIAQNNAIQNRLVENEILKQDQDLRSRKVSEYYEKRIRDQNVEYHKALSDIKSSGGLRISSSICNGFTETSSTKGPTPNNGKTTLRLPDEVERDLIELADDANTVSARLLSCQMWIKENGFYP